MRFSLFVFYNGAGRPGAAEMDLHYFYNDLLPYLASLGQVAKFAQVSRGVEARNSTRRREVKKV